MRKFEFRGYEIHSSRMWQQAQVDMALEFMVKEGLNALIFHQNDLVDQLVFPEKYYDNDILWERWPVRRQGVLYQRDYMSGVIRRAKEKEIGFYLEIKEIYTLESIFELFPELRNADGTVCPNHPFWLEFLEEKFRELFELFPDIAGIIVSLGTRESPVSIAANRCHCERCRKTADLDWYVNVLKAMYGPISQAGKELIVRDFAYTAKQQSLMIQACEAVSDRIIIALKAQPHDYYPTFPINPEIGNTGKLREYIEFDTWGQYFGMGVAPMSLVEDMKERLEICYEKGAAGAWFRTDWELIHDASVHCTPSLVNLYAGAMLTGNLDTELDEIYRRWVKEGLYSPLKNASQLQENVTLTNPEAWKNLRNFMKASWEAFAGAAYILGHQYLESDQPPYTIDKAFEIMTVIHSRDDWEEGASKRVAVTKENMEVIFAEKKKAIAQTKELYGILDIDALGAPAAFAEDMKAVIRTMVLFAQFCDVTTRAMYLTVWAEKTGELQDAEKARATVTELLTMADSLEQELEGTNYPYYLYSRLHPRRIRRFAADVERRVEVLL
nr:hypothetical protein [uncultured Acetatifactor sp.]